ncbi:hypothetical protein [Pelagibius marinus]|uniref:hypothetical protein n=1 Tax=Pelagibius marinus TaxID=2762760 RepID=UPI0018731CC7|nr:hypothetical protein [Pelagibius marinus]
MSRLLRSSAFLLITALAVSACQTARNEPPQTTATPSATPAPEPAATPASPMAPAPAPQVTLRAPEPPINDDPGQFMGLDRGGVAALLGDPALIRREEPAEIWQYVTSGCVVDVVLYAAGQRYAVSYLEARDETSAAVQEVRPCLNKLLRARQSAPVS